MILKDLSSFLLSKSDNPPTIPFGRKIRRCRAQAVATAQNPFWEKDDAQQGTGIDHALPEGPWWDIARCSAEPFNRNVKLVYEHDRARYLEPASELLDDVAEDIGCKCCACSETPMGERYLHSSLRLEHGLGVFVVLVSDVERI